MAEGKDAAQQSPYSGVSEVAVVMGSQSDWAVMRHAVTTLAGLAITVSARIVSAHRTPERMVEFASSASEAGFRVIIAGAGGAAHLPGMIASLTDLPVLGVPIPTGHLNGLDSLLSIVQMPAGIPVGTLAIGRAGAINAGLLAARILALHRPALAAQIERARIERRDGVAEYPADIALEE